jgi:hypothetical protein
MMSFDIKRESFLSWLRIKRKSMYKYVVSLALLATLHLEAAHTKIKGELINIQANIVSIATDDVCYWQKRRNIIRCESGRVIKKPIQKEGALTGTPGYLSGSGYIGYIVIKPSKPWLMGSGKRIDFYMPPGSKAKIMKTQREFCANHKKVRKTAS